MIKVKSFRSKTYTRRFDFNRRSTVAADVLNDVVVPWFEQEAVRVLRILTDRGAEYCEAREHHEYELYLRLEDIDHIKFCLGHLTKDTTVKKGRAGKQMQAVSSPAYREYLLKKLLLMLWHLVKSP
jgi:hypothetical protein